MRKHADDARKSAARLPPPPHPEHGSAGRLQPFVLYAGTIIDAAGVLIVVGGATLATLNFLRLGRGQWRDAYHPYRQDLGRAILLGLEFLVAGDIIRTVAVEPTLEKVFVLGIVVTI